MTGERGRELLTLIPLAERDAPSEPAEVDQTEETETEETPTE